MSVIGWGHPKTSPRMTLENATFARKWGTLPNIALILVCPFLLPVVSQQPDLTTWRHTKLRGTFVNHARSQAIPQPNAGRHTRSWF